VSEWDVDTEWTFGGHHGMGRPCGVADRDVCSVTVSGIRGSRRFPDLDEDIVADPAPLAVVLTAIPVEYEAVRDHLLDVREQVHDAGTIFDLGRLRNGPWRIALARTGQGNSHAAALAERAISFYRPDMVMFVGVAGRLHTDLAFGDVVLAKKIYAIHSGTENDTGFRPRPISWQPDHGHLQRAERVAQSGAWRNARPDRRRAEAKAVVRAIASGEVVLDSVDSPLARLIKEQYNDAAAIEMEGAGAAVASHLNKSLPMVVLRGISDYANGQKEVADREGWQEHAARNAAAFAVTLLTEFTPARWAASPEAARAVEEDLLSGRAEQQVAAADALSSGRFENAVPVLIRGFEETFDPDVSCRIIVALGRLGTIAARDALRTLNPRYLIERLAIRDGLEAWQEPPE
jgi:nucleoside phosphorylase